MIRYALLILTLLSCSKNQEQACDELGTRKYKGWPKEARQYDNECRGKVKHKYTPELCQQALQGLMVSGDVEKVKQVFGDPVMECFTGNDLKNYKDNPVKLPPK